MIAMNEEQKRVNLITRYEEDSDDIQEETIVSIILSIFLYSYRNYILVKFKPLHRKNEIFTSTLKLSVGLQQKGFLRSIP